MANSDCFPTNILLSPNNPQGGQTTLSHIVEKKNYTTPYSNFSVKDDLHIKHAQKLKEAKQVFREVGEDPFESLVMVDAILRLGIDHYFREEIEEALQKQYMETITCDDDYDNLYEVSLRFRHLRQEGYNVPADVFNNFIGKDGKFKKKLSTDIRGLMALYEAAQLSIEGEDILDEAAHFSSQQLMSWVAHLDHSESKMVGNTLKYPYHKSIARFTAKSFLRDVKGTNLLKSVFQELAEMDFNMVKSIHQKELRLVSKWWEDLGLTKELKFARDQPHKWHMWSMTVLTDPMLSQQRINLTKPISLIYVIDDIFDLYGTLDELTLFTQAVNRWEVGAFDQLPDYMKLCFKALTDTTNEISIKVYEDCGWDPTNYLRRAWATLCDAFLVEAKWFALGHIPRADEYLRNGVVSTGVNVVLVHLFFLLGHGMTKESVTLVNNNPAIISSVATILRLWDDMGSAKDENQDGHDGSYIDCYMKENKGCSVETARQHVVNMISDTWKLLNQECFSPTPFSQSFRNASLNAARLVPLMYSYDDNQCLPVLGEHIKSMLVDDLFLKD